MSNDIDVQDHGSVFNHDAVVRFARSGGTSAPMAPLTVSRDTASSRLLGPYPRDRQQTGRIPLPEAGLREVAVLIDGIPGVSGAAFEIDHASGFERDHFDDEVSDNGKPGRS